MTAIEKWYSMSPVERDVAVAEIMGYKPVAYEGQKPNSLWSDKAIFESMMAAGLTHTYEGEAVRIPKFARDAASDFSVLKWARENWHHNEVHKMTLALGVLWFKREYDGSRFEGAEEKWNGGTMDPRVHLVRKYEIGDYAYALYIAANA